MWSSEPPVAAVMTAGVPKVPSAAANTTSAGVQQSIVQKVATIHIDHLCMLFAMP
jgi:hypothetical protein